MQWQAIQYLFNRYSQVLFPQIKLTKKRALILLQPYNEADELDKFDLGVNAQPHTKNT